MISASRSGGGCSTRTYRLRRRIGSPSRRSSLLISTTNEILRPRPFLVVRIGLRCRLGVLPPQRSIMSATTGRRNGFSYHPVRSAATHHDCQRPSGGTQSGRSRQQAGSVFDAARRWNLHDGEEPQCIRRQQVHGPCRSKVDGHQELELLQMAINHRSQRKSSSRFRKMKHPECTNWSRHLLA